MKRASLKVNCLGRIVFNDHEEHIISLRAIEDTTDIFEIITMRGLYVCDMSKPDDDYRCRLYKQIITPGSFPQTIKSQLHACKYEYIDLTDL